MTQPISDPDGETTPKAATRSEKADQNNPDLEEAKALIDSGRELVRTLLCEPEELSGASLNIPMVLEVRL